MRDSDGWIMVVAAEMVGSDQICLFCRQSLQDLLMYWMGEVRKIKDSRMTVRFYFFNATYFYLKLFFCVLLCCLSPLIRLEYKERRNLAYLIRYCGTALSSESRTVPVPCIHEYINTDLIVFMEACPKAEI